MKHEREQEIFKNIVEQYIKKADPVGSRALQKEYNLSISPATIRNIMSDLEDMGYLIQPHKSAGRVPTSKGYRRYIDTLINIRRFTIEEKERIKSEYINKVNELSDILKITASVISYLTGHASIVTIPSYTGFRIKRFEILNIASGKLLFVFITSTGFVKDAVITGGENFGDETLERFSNFLNYRFYGMKISDIKAQLSRGLAEEAAGFEKLLDLLKDALDYFDGDENNFLINQNLNMVTKNIEFNDIEKIKKFFTVINNRQILRNLIDETLNDKKMLIKIGDEQGDESLKEFSYIGSKFCLDGEASGIIGIIGPTRMQYEKTLSVSNAISEIVTDICENIFG